MGVGCSVWAAGVAAADVWGRDVHSLPDLDGWVEHLEEDAGVQNSMTGNQFELAVGATPSWDEFDAASRDSSESIAGLLMADDSWAAGGHVKQLPVTDVSTRTGFLWESFVDQLYGRIWITPSSIDFGVLARESDYSVYVWNAYRSVSVDLLSITDVGVLDGITIDATLPETILPTGQVMYVLTAAPVGGIVIEGYKQFNFSGLPPIGLRAETLSLEGLRAVVLNYMHNWEKNFDVQYGFQTLIAQTRKFYEQRSQINSQCRRSVSVSLLESSDRVYRLQNLLNSGRSAPWIVPLYSEPISLNMTGSLLGLTTLNTIEDLTTYWNLIQYDWMVLLFNTETEEAEVVEVSSVGTNSIELVEGPKNDWDAADVIAFTAMVSYVRANRIEYPTDQVGEVSLEMEEYVSGRQLHEPGNDYCEVAARATLGRGAESGLADGQTGDFVSWYDHGDRAGVGRGPVVTGVHVSEFQQDRGVRAAELLL